ncbi:hypothetical protein GCM10011318_13680 [Phaeocystidibacter marisrubri]|nr:hypothetical protein GCM10011318_13680 [Phaeocystidibacter marisrubri]
MAAQTGGNLIAVLFLDIHLDKAIAFNAGILIGTLSIWIYRLYTLSKKCYIPDMSVESDALHARVYSQLYGENELTIPIEDISKITVSPRQKRKRDYYLYRCTVRYITSEKLWAEEKFYVRSWEEAQKFAALKVRVSSK